MKIGKRRRKLIATKPKSTENEIPVAQTHPCPACKQELSLTTRIKRHLSKHCKKMRALWVSDPSEARRIIQEFNLKCDQKAATVRVGFCSCMIADPKTYLCRDVFQYLDLQAPITELQLKSNNRIYPTVFFRYETDET
jgi:predicted O-linked N-acetylglucosamine transferase (SPINDLY family)